MRNFWTLRSDFKTKISRSISRVLSGICQIWHVLVQPFIWEKCYHFPHATYPNNNSQNMSLQPNGYILFLFGFAPGGVYHAITITGDAVGSYPTLSPLPVLTKQAVFFLWH